MTDKTQPSTATEPYAPLGAWRPADTAPYNEDPIWLYDGKHIFIGGREYVEGDGWLWWRNLAGIDWSPATGWYVVDSETDDIHPTLWMPMPCPPTQAAESRS